MKRTVLFLLMGALLIFSSCGQGNNPTPGFDAEDLILAVDGVAYRCDDNIETVWDHLGEDYQYAEGMSCDYDGLDKTFAYSAATFYTNPLTQGDLVNEIYTEDPSVTTSRGISVGASREEVLAAYGEDCEDLGDLLIYSLPGQRASLCFELDGSGVWAIYLTTQPV